MIYYDEAEQIWYDETDYEWACSEPYPDQVPTDLTFESKLEFYVWYDEISA